MLERQLGEFIPLARAAALAYAELFPEEPVTESKALDIMALALSALLPLYQRDMENGSLRRLDESETIAGRFTRGATTLEFPDRAPLRYLAVRRAQVRSAVESMRQNALIEGRLSLTLRQARPAGREIRRRY